MKNRKWTNKQKLESFSKESRVKSPSLSFVIVIKSCKPNITIGRITSSGTPRKSLTWASRPPPKSALKKKTASLRLSSGISPWN